MSYAIRFLQNTILKLSTQDSSTLPQDQLYSISKGFSIPISSWAEANGHIKFALGKDAKGQQLTFIPRDGKPRNTWYAFGMHVQVLKDGRPIAPPPNPKFIDGVKFLPKVAPAPIYLLVYPQDAADQFGGELFTLAKVRDGVIEDGVTIVSGQPGLRGILPEDDYSGSMRPCPEGKFNLGIAESGSFGNAIGRHWISVYGTDPRQSIGIHEDANRPWSPGSAGCLCPLNETDTIKVMEWRRQGFDRLVVNHGLGSV